MGDELDPEELTHRLNDLGYFKKERVFSKAEYASRGSIVDVFSCSDNLPVRIEFLGDIVSSIRIFEVDTMASVNEVKEFYIYPATEFPRLNSY